MSETKALHNYIKRFALIDGEGDEMSDTKALDEFFDMRRKHATNYPDAWWELEYINKATAELAQLRSELDEARKMLDMLGLLEVTK
jgi:hypothetical protein